MQPFLLSPLLSYISPYSPLVTVASTILTYLTNLINTQLEARVDIALIHFIILTLASTIIPKPLLFIPLVLISPPTTLPIIPYPSILFSPHIYLFFDLFPSFSPAYSDLHSILLNTFYASSSTFSYIHPLPFSISPFHSLLNQLIGFFIRDHFDLL